MSRSLWFVAGAAAGVYGMVRGRRAAEALTPDGLRDRWAGLTLGAQLFAEEVRAGMTEREVELRSSVGRAIEDQPRRPELAVLPGGKIDETDPHDEDVPDAEGPHPDHPPRHDPGGEQ